MACAAARTVLGEEFEVRDIRFEATLLLDDETPVSAVASVTSPGTVDFVVETFGDGAQIRRATAVLHAGGDDDQPAAYDIPALLATHLCPLDGAEMRKQFDEHGLQYGPAFAGLAAVHSGDETLGTVLGRSGCPARCARNRTHTASIPPCWMPVFKRLRLIPTPRVQAVLV